MGEASVGSEAFQRAELRSERSRILALIAALAALLLVVVVRFLMLASGGGDLLLPFTLVLGLAALYETGIFMLVRRALASGAVLPRWLWPLNVVLEALIPTAGLVLLTESEFMGPYLALTAPVVLVYFVLIILSTLRLSPAQAFLSGLSAAAGYAGVLAWTLVAHPIASAPAGSFPLVVYLTFAALLLVGGGVAAAVAREIRGHAGAAVAEARKAERLHRDLEVARKIQQGLLPARPPRIAGFDVAGWNRPADQTGGDHFDYLPRGEGQWVVTLADVTGHGIGAALMTAACRAYGRASLKPAAGLGEALGGINDLLCHDLPPGKLATYVAALLTPSASRVLLLSAGHGPLLVYRTAEDRMESFAAHGVPLGVMAGMKYPSAQDLDLAPGDLLVLITDGFLEWEDGAGEPFGLDRLREALREAKDQSAAEVIDRLQAAVGRFAGGTAQQDDLTAVVVKRLPEP